MLGDIQAVTVTAAAERVPLPLVLDGRLSHESPAPDMPKHGQNLPVPVPCPADSERRIPGPTQAGPGSHESRVKTDSPGGLGLGTFALRHPGPSHGPSCRSMTLSGQWAAAMSSPQLPAARSPGPPGAAARRRPRAGVGSESAARGQRPQPSHPSRQQPAPARRRAPRQCGPRRGQLPRLPREHLAAPSAGSVSWAPHHDHDGPGDPDRQSRTSRLCQCQLRLVTAAAWTRSRRRSTPDLRHGQAAARAAPSLRSLFGLSRSES